MTRALAVLVALSISIGCGGDPTDDGPPPPTPDGGIADVGSSSSCTIEPEAPREAALPRAIDWECPSGWRADEGACSPWPESGPADCPEGEAHFPGTAGCEPIGTACPAGEFTDPPPDYASWDRIYVNPNAAPGGDGTTPETAMSSFRDARLAARALGRPAAILLARGEYPSGDPIGLPRDSIVWGACVRDTTILPAAGAALPVIAGAVEGWSGLGNVTITGPTRAVFTSTAGIELHLEGVLIRDVVRSGLLAQDGARITGRRVVVRNVTSPSALARGVGITAIDAAVELSQVIAEGNASGVAVAPGATAVLEDAFLRGNEDSGAIAFVDSSLTLRRADVAMNSGYGVFTLDGTLVIEDGIVRDTTYLDEEAAGQGIVAGDSADLPGRRSEVRLSRVLVAGNERVGIWLDGEGQALTATQTIIRDTRSRFVSTSTSGDGIDGGGLAISAEAAVDIRLDRVRMERNRVTALGVFGPGGRVTGTDVVIEDVFGGIERLDGNAISIEDGSSAELTRTLIERANGAGIEVTGGSSASFEDLTVLDSAVAGTGQGGAGMVAGEEGTRVLVERGRFERNELYGIIAQERASLEMNDVAIIGTRALAAGGVFGIGLAVNEDARVVGRRVFLEENRAAGIVAANGAGLELDQITVRRTLIGLSSHQRGLGRGIAIEIGATATVTNALVEENLDVGIIADEGSRLLLRDAAVIETAGIDRAFGRGLQAQDLSFVQLERVCLADNREVGLLASRAQIFGRDVSVLGTLHNECFDLGLCDPPGGIGVYAATGGEIALSRFLLSRNVETGLTIAGGEVDLIDGVVSFSALGADVRDPSYDQSRITTTVIYSNNQIDGVEARNTPLPDTDTAGLY